MKFRLVFEIDEIDEESKEKRCFCVWSKPFTESLDIKSGFRRFVEKWFGRPLTPSELAEFDTEKLIGKPAMLVVTHSTGESGDTYANIDSCLPHKNGEPLQPSGTFIRKKDRDEKKEEGAGGGAQFRKAEQPEDAGRDDWQKVKVHVGKHSGVELGDLDEAAIRALHEKWIPVAESKPKMLADDKRLVAGLKAAVAELEAPAEPAPEPEY